MKKIIVSHRSKHHSGYSGYSRLIDFLEDTIAIPSGKSKNIVPYRIAKFIASNLDKKKGEYNTDSVEKEAELFKVLTKYKDKKSIIHYLNAERDIRFAINQKWYYTKDTFIGTFHKPNEILKKQIPKTKYLKMLDGAICVGPNQVDFIKDWLNIDNVKFIPHGIDTNFFTPDNTKREESTLLFVGQHLRDFKSFNYCIPKIAEKIPDLKVNVILHSSYMKYIEPHNAVKVFSKVNDIDLKQYYQNATALFLPMLNSTACNSILEAMAMGLPIISSDVGGNYGYVNDKNAILVPKGDDDFLIDTTVALLKNEDKLNKMSLMSIEASKQFDWKNVAKQVNDFYSYCAIN